MSIKEVLERIPEEEKNSEAQRQKKLWHLREERRSFEASHRKNVLEAGRSILGEAGVPKLLKDLAELIRLDFPDVKTEERLMANGTVSSSIMWHFGDTLERKPFKQKYNAVEIIAYPLTDDLLVVGGEEIEVLSKSQRSSDSKLLENAIVRAYRKPIQRTESPEGI